MTRPRYTTTTAQSAVDLTTGASRTSAFVMLEFCPLKPKGERRYWSKTLRPILVGSSVHKAVLGEQGEYYDFLRKMYRLPKNAVK